MLHTIPVPTTLPPPTYPASLSPQNPIYPSERARLPKGSQQSMMTHHFEVGSQLNLG